MTLPTLPNSIFSHELDTFTLQADAESVSLSINTFSSEHLFTSVYYPCDGEVTIYNLREVVESYCIRKNTPAAGLTLRFTAGDENLSLHVIVVYSVLNRFPGSADEFREGNFFTTNTSQLISPTQPVALTFHETESSIVKVSALVRIGDVSSTQLFQYSIKPHGVYVIDVSYAAIHERLNAELDASFVILSYKVQVGKRLCRFYVNQQPCSHVFRFRNAFNAEEYIAISSATAVQTQTDYAEATLDLRKAHYDVQHLRTYSEQTPALLLPQAQWLNEFLTSPYVELMSSSGQPPQEVLIEDYTSDLSNDPGAENSITFRWSFAKPSATLDLLHTPEGCFTEHFNETFD